MGFEYVNSACGNCEFSEPYERIITITIPIMPDPGGKLCQSPDTLYSVDTNSDVAFSSLDLGSC